MSRHGLACDARLERRDEAFEHERRLSGAGDARNDGQPPLRYLKVERAHGVQRLRAQRDAPLCEHLFARRAPPRRRRLAFREEAAYQRSGVVFYILYRAFGDYPAAARPGARPHLYHPFRGAQHARVVVHHYDGVAVRNEVAHDAEQPLYVRRMQPYRRLV